MTQVRPAHWTCLAALATLLLGMGGEEYRYSRPVEAAPGYAGLDLPNDVLAAASADLRDLRLYAGDRELPYALESRLGAPAKRLSPFDVESTAAEETRALVDRGPSPGFATRLTLEVAGVAPFLKPLVVEASDDRSQFSTIARTSIFRTESASSLSVYFPENDRRYWRMRFDDRLGEAIVPTAVIVHDVNRQESRATPVPARLEREADADAAIDRYSVILPSANLPTTAIGFVVDDRAFSRELRVFERLVFRGQLSRRLVGEGRIERLVDGSAHLEIPLSELRSARLEIEVERAGASLGMRSAHLLVEPKRIVFFAPEDEPMRLVYGAANVAPPRYDLELVLARGKPPSASVAQLGAVTDHGARSPLPPIPRGSVIDTTAYRRRHVVSVPHSGSLAYLDIPGLTPNAAHSIRLIAADGRQVPFIVESTPVRQKVPLNFVAQVQGHRTIAKVTAPAGEALVGLELRASSPAVFRRQLELVETLEDERGRVGRRVLTSASWEKRPDQALAHIVLALPASTERGLALEIENADNPPLVIAEAVGEVARARIDFAFEPEEALTLLADPPSPTWAKYDLEVLSELLLGAPALPATLGPSSVANVSRPRSHSPWLLAAFAAAAALVLAALLRVLRRDVD